MLEIVTAVCSERGLRKTNEDAVHVSHDAGVVLAVVADGAGGHRDGATASRLAIERFATSLRAAPWFEAEALDAAVVAAHRGLREVQAHEDALERMHTTIVAVWIDANNARALWTNVGDSRLYVARRGRLALLSVDDSIVQRMLDAGLLTAEQADAHPHKNQLAAALGVDEDIEPHTSQQRHDLVEGDAFLLCSDGWWGAIDEQAIVDALLASSNPEQWLAKMQRTIADRAEPRQDNFSAVGIWVTDTEDITQPLSARPE